MGGMLAEPAKTLPGIFGENRFLGFQLFRDYPFALPSLINALLLAFATALIFLFMEEVGHNLSVAAGELLLTKFHRPWLHARTDSTMAYIYKVASSR